MIETDITLEKARQIRAIYDEIEDSDPDISTERLIAMTVDRCKIAGYDFVEDNCEVCEALILLADEDSNEPT